MLAYVVPKSVHHTDFYLAAAPPTCYPLAMFIRKTTHTNNKNGQTYFTHKPMDEESGYYVLRSNLNQADAKEVFDIFNMLLDVEDAFRSMKSELGLRPVHHQIEYRSDGHLFITVLAYHVLQSIRLKLKAHGLTHGWATIRQRLSTHYRVTTSMKRSDGKVVYVRKTAKPEECHIRIYNALDLPSRPGKTSKIIL